MPVAVDPGGDQDAAGNHAPSLPDFHRQGVGCDEREGAGITEGAVAELAGRAHPGRLPCARPMT